MDNVALVTGADRGLGRALAGELLERGWTVLAGRHLDWPELDELSEKFPSSLHIIPLDVSSDQSVKAAGEIAKESVSHIDLLISNAGINRSAHISSVRQPLDFDDMLTEANVNAIGALRVVATFLALLDNDLVSEGYSFRLYHPGWLRSYLRGTKNTQAQMEPEEAAAIAVSYFLEPQVPERLELRDWEGSTLPW